MKRAGQLVRHAGPEHVLVFAPTRSGKGIGTVIPTLLCWEASAVVYDIKKELWAQTAGWRRKFSHCWRFEPTASGGVRYNPLFEIRKGRNEVRDAQTVAEILIDPDGKLEKDHWKISGASLLTAVILHVLYAEGDKSLRGVSAFLSEPSRTQIETLKRMLTTAHLPTGPHPVVAQTARSMISKSDNELSGVISTAKAALTLYDDEIVAENTRTSDFRISDLMNADSPVSLYLVVPPSDIERTRPLIRLVLQQFGKRLTEKMDSEPGKAAYKHRLLMLLDEFPSLGRLSFFESALAFSAGYGIKCFLICQSLNQLDKAYGRDNSIVDNCHVRMAYAANRSETAKTISELIGQTTAAKLQRSLSGKGALGSRSVSESEQEFARQLLTPDEILRLPFDDAILMVGGMPAYRGRKIMYYLDDRFSGRAGPWWRPPESNEEQGAELIERAPSVWETPAPSLNAPVVEVEASEAAAASPTGATVGDVESTTGASATLDAGWARFFGALEDAHGPEVASPNGGDVDPPKRPGSLPL
jgi:type IV secretion system protein VirD4